MFTPGQGPGSTFGSHDLLGKFLAIAAILTGSVLTVWASRALMQSKAPVPVPPSANAATATNADVSSGSCGVEEPEVDPATDVHAITTYKRWVSQLLKDKKFDQLDCVARAARTQKSRFVGGEWKIHKLYVGLEEPNPDMNATQEEWNAHLDLLNEWVDARPESITARVALAHAYVSYAWYARGDGMADSVSGGNWQLFEKRMVQAETVLNDASSLKEKCPEWYMVMQQVATGESWPKQRALELFQQAVAFEPDYFYFHRLLAGYLLPKWYGQEGDTSGFLQLAADKLTGPEGDGMYFLMSAEVVCTCDEPEFTRMSWPRLQRGFAYVEKKYGMSMEALNVYALMATKFNDSVTASDTFQRIGDNWSEHTWGSEKYYDENRKWATQFAELENAHRASVKEAEANSSSPDGAKYRKAVEQTFSGLLTTCADTAKDTHDKFDLFLKVGQSGNFEGIYFDPASTPMKLAGCLLTQVMTPRAANQPAALPVPPKADYWVKVEVDPAAALQASTK